MLKVILHVINEIILLFYNTFFFSIFLTRGQENSKTDKRPLLFKQYLHQRRSAETPFYKTLYDQDDLEAITFR